MCVVRFLTTLAIAGFALVVVTGATARGFSGDNARAELGRAVERTLAAAQIQSERTTEPDLGAGIMVEDYIAPHRLRTLLPPNPLIEGVPNPPTELIGIGRRVYIQDRLAKPPANELFVTCLQEKPVIPEFFGYLAMVADAEDIRREPGSDDRYRFHLDVEGKVLKKALDGLAGEAVVDGGRVTSFRFKAKDADGADLVWRLSFDAVIPITPPGSDEIVRQKCNFTSGVPVGSS
jgi:hypothetical protein